MDMFEIVMKLVGPVRAVGETNEDGRRLQNLKELTELTGMLLVEINVVSANAHHSRASEKAIKKHADEFLADALTS